MTKSTETGEPGAKKYSVSLEDIAYRRTLMWLDIYQKVIRRVLVQCLTPAREQVSSHERQQ